MGKYNVVIITIIRVNYRVAVINRVFSKLTETLKLDIRGSVNWKSKKKKNERVIDNNRSSTKLLLWKKT